MNKRRAIVNRELGIALIPLGGKKYPGRFALVDAWLAPFLEMVNWQPGCNGQGVNLYAKGYVHAEDGSGTIRMHAVLCPSNGMDVDHINGNGLDNRMANLRACPRMNNLWNQRPRKSGCAYKGVYRDKSRRKWRARITVSRKTVSLGAFLTPEEAARAYDKASRELFGEFARLNFPDE